MTLPVVGDISERISSSFEWRIPIRNLRLDEDDNAQSPSFQFWDATWNLGSWFRKGLGLYVVRNDWKQNRQVVAFKLSARRKDGTECIIDEDELQFTKEENESFSSFIDEEFLFRQLVHDDNLTVFCSLYGNRSIVNAAKRRSEEDCTKENETQDTEDQIKLPKRGTKDFENLSRNFKDLLVTAQDSDVTVRVSDREFPVHKLILCARSPVFEKMFRHDMTEKNEGVVDIRDCTPDAFKEFLFYIYSGELDEFSRNTVFDLYMLSDKYDVRQLKSASVEFISEDLCIDTFCDVVHLALQHKEAVLLEKATNFFAENLKKIIVSIKWQSFITENPVEANELYIRALTDVRPA